MRGIKQLTGLAALVGFLSLTPTNLDAYATRGELYKGGIKPTPIQKIENPFYTTICTPEFFKENDKDKNGRLDEYEKNNQTNYNCDRPISFTTEIPPEFKGKGEAKMFIQGPNEETYDLTKTNLNRAPNPKTNNYILGASALPKLLHDWVDKFGEGKFKILIEIESEPYLQKSITLTKD